MMRRVNRCVLYCDGSFIDAYCGAISDETRCSKYEPDEIDPPCCRHSSGDTSCSNTDARKDAATRIVKVLRRKYGVEA